MVHTDDELIPPLYVILAFLLISICDFYTPNIHNRGSFLQHLAYFTLCFYVNQLIEIQLLLRLLYYTSQFHLSTLILKF